MKTSTVWFWGGIAAWGICFALSVHAFPLPWQDEVHIVEMGRCALNSNPAAPSFAIVGDGAGFNPFYFLGPCLQECSFRFGGMIGPRISSMLGLLVLAFFCRKWVLQRWGDGILSNVAFWLVLLDSLLVHSARLVRVDTWAFALLFLSLIVFRSSWLRRTRMAWVGALSAVNLFVWPSTVLFAPFLLLQCIDDWRENRVGFRTMAADVAYAAGAAVAVAGTCLLLSPAGVAKTLSVYYGTTGAGLAAHPSLFGIAKSSVIVWTKEMLRDPVLFFLVSIGAVGLCIRRHFLPLVLGGLCFVLMIPSGLHTYRLLYVWPFLLELALQGVRTLKAACPRFAMPFLATGLAFAALGNALLYAVMAVAFPRPDAAEVCRRLGDGVGHGPETCVYSMSFQTYYAGRSLGWKQYRYSDNDDAYCAEATNLLKRVSAVLIPTEEEFYAAEESFTPFGLIRNHLINLARADAACGTATCLGSLGAQFAFRRADPRKMADFEHRLTELGFRRTGVISFSDFHANFVPGLEWLRQLLLSVPGYDDLVVWTRK